MPCVSGTPWGVWGVPEKTEAWSEERPKLRCDSGGALKPKFANTIQWYYERATNQQDKERCLDLLAQFERQKRSDVKVADRPKTAPRLSTPAKTTQTDAKLRSKSVRLAQEKSRLETAADNQGNVSAYKRQVQSVNRLSRPQTARSDSHRYRISYDRSQEYKACPRPKSAMANLEKLDMQSNYITTNEVQFPGHPADQSAEATRPMSSKGFTAPYELSGPIGATTFKQQYAWKTAPKEQPIRTGTSSGNRNNNPHPHESFMVWRLQNKAVHNSSSAPAKHLGYRTLNEAVLNQILKDRYRSTYQNDFLGIPQGYQVKDAIDTPGDWRTRLNRPTHTTTRHTYKTPVQHPALAEATTRYGSNKNKLVPALGAVPTVTKAHVQNQEHIKGRTSYEEHYRNRHSHPDFLKLLNSQSNQKVIDSFLRYSKVAETEEKF